MQDKIEHLIKVQHEHALRFANGREVMTELKADIAALKPKAPDWVKLLMSGLAVIGILMGAQLWMTDRFAERPKWGQVEEALRPIKESQTGMRETVRAIEASQAQQAASIRAIERAQESQSEKLDELVKAGRRGR